MLKKEENKELGCGLLRSTPSLVQVSLFSSLKRFQALAGRLTGPSRGPYSRRLLAQHDCLCLQRPQPALFIRT